ncbi:MAG TPA: glutamate--tRNA ligase family protein [Saprospiraceae bacterium]|nr:glutamate--tRNA ligase family protein [Saprospiraceae bacterium]HND88293.1 glutamate--tRNA ligase family protein [Saprospiraceae bacterium]HNG89926.1 glutamate--tRNA ligase family protein [Saprospiraceae bacterium]
MTAASSFAEFLQQAGPGCRLRYAPTPSGYLHLGNAFNFWLSAQVARRYGGCILLRIDDLDAERKRPEYLADILDSLEWLGLEWHEGPGCSPHFRQQHWPDPAARHAAFLQDFEENWSQHRRTDLYAQVLGQLRQTGLLYACRKSRRDLAPFGGKYPPEFREQGLSLDDADVAWRVATPPDFPLPDFIVRRRDGLPAYQVASLADDLHFGITHIVRGADLLDSTAAQRWLAERLGLSAFLDIAFFHHPLLTDECGEKLSKSAGATSLRAMREAGRSAEGLCVQLEAMSSMGSVP